MIGVMSGPSVARDMTAVRGKRVTVFGLGRFGGGIAVARWLAEQGASVTVTDKQTADKLADSVRQLEGVPVTFHLGAHVEEDFTQAELIVASPAIPPHNEYLKKAAAAGVPITSEIRLFIERCPCKIFGVTGTKGKSTTSAMLGEMLRRRFKVWVGGNIGKSLLADLEPMEPGDLVVLELSSFMLERLAPMRWSPHVAVVTMISSDHLDWHGSAEAYLSAKKNILRFQRADDFAILNGDNPAAASWAAETSASVIRYGVDRAKPFELIVPGKHNQLNAQGAFAAAEVVGVSWEDAQEALRNFKGLPHRLQLVREANGVRYFNDSIATVPDAAVAALESFPPKKVVQIVGGYDKGLPLTPLCNALVERAKAALCIGATGNRIADATGTAVSPMASAAAVYRCGDLVTAMKMARQIAGPGDVVLLSPGCASYDQFENFEKRGEAFAELARGA